MILDEIKAEIVANSIEINDLTQVIKDFDEECIKEETEENKLFLMESIERYKIVVEKTKILLEALFEEERKKGVPTDFLYRRLYKKILEAI